MSAEVPASAQADAGDPFQYSPLKCSDQDKNWIITYYGPPDNRVEWQGPDLDWDGTWPAGGLCEINSTPPDDHGVQQFALRPEKWVFHGYHAIWVFADRTVFDKYKFQDMGPGHPPGDTGNRCDGVVPEAQDAFLLTAVLVRTKTGFIAGHVYQQGGTPEEDPIENAQVTVRQGDQVVVGPCPTGQNGGYFFFGLAPGTYAMSCTAGGYKPATKEGVGVTRNQTTTVDFALEMEQMEPPAEDPPGDPPPGDPPPGDPPPGDPPPGDPPPGDPPPGDPPPGDPPPGDPPPGDPPPDDPPGP